MDSIPRIFPLRLFKGVDIRKYGSGKTGATNALRLLGWQGFAAVICGVSVGAGLTAVLLRVLREITTGLGSNYATSFGIAMGLVLVAAGIACYLPALRAAKVDPMVALRYE